MRHDELKEKKAILSVCEDIWEKKDYELWRN